jgi:hypothetical protein
MRGFVILVAVCVVLGCGSHEKYRPDRTLSVDKQDSFKYEIIRYVGRLPKQASEDTKFDSRFDQAYRSMAKSMGLDKYYEHPGDGYTYFEMSRIAPSLYEKYVATGGRLKRDGSGRIVEYEEIYRTWKMKKEDLAARTAIFFDRMVKGEDLSPYYTANIGDTEHIEFPDDNVSYNKEQRRWTFTQK